LDGALVDIGWEEDLVRAVGGGTAQAAWEQGDLSAGFGPLPIFHKM
jgi:hypothetical protein